MTTTKKDPSAIYGADWFRQFHDLRAEFRAMGSALFEVFKPRSVLDLGCGPGMTIDRMRELGCIVHGIEGSVHGIAIAPEDVKPFIAHRDITLGGDVPTADLVICTEVAEHLEAEHADTLVAMLAGAMTPSSRLFFTAAPPGQGGHDHVNEQPMVYWLAKFAEHGIRSDGEANARVLAQLVVERPRDLWAQNWLFANSVVLVRA